MKEVNCLDHATQLDFCMCDVLCIVDPDFAQQAEVHPVPSWAVFNVSFGEVAPRSFTGYLTMIPTSLTEMQLSMTLQFVVVPFLSTLK